MRDVRSLAIGVGVLLVLGGLVVAACYGLDFIGGLLPRPPIGNLDRYVNDLGNGAIWVGTLLVAGWLSWAIGDSL